MTSRTLLAVCICIGLCVAALRGQTVLKNPPAASGPATQPTVGTGVIAKVGEATITSERIDRMFAQAIKQVPAQRRIIDAARVRQNVIQTAIFEYLTRAYIKANKISCDEKELKKAKSDLTAEAERNGKTLDELMKAYGITEEDIKATINARTLLRDAASPAKLAAFIKAHPDYFNGTKVRASHILIACPLAAATTDQKAALAKIKAIAADIKGGKTTFEAAAKAHSACPSGKKAEGDLGEFAFGNMVPPFAMAAFDMKIGEISGVVRTRFGFHLIKLTGRIAGSAKPGPMAERIAGGCLTAKLRNRVVSQALSSCPIVIPKK